NQLEIFPFLDSTTYSNDELCLTHVDFSCRTLKGVQHLLANLDIITRDLTAMDFTSSAGVWTTEGYGLNGHDLGTCSIHLDGCIHLVSKHLADKTKIPLSALKAHTISD